MGTIAPFSYDPTDEADLINALRYVNEGNWPPQQKASLIDKIINEWDNLLPKYKTTLHIAEANKVPDNPVVVAPSFHTVREFERQIAEFFGAPYAVAVDSCTSAVELCLRYTQATTIYSPRNTYLSIPMLARKLNLPLEWWAEGNQWVKYYVVSSGIIDAATYWEKGGYIDRTFMCISFQHQKHLSVGRLGCILTHSQYAADELRMMAHDGRPPGLPWREQNVAIYGYHYYAQPELCQIALDKLPAAIATPAKVWDSSMYPDISKFDVFK